MAENKYTDYSYPSIEPTDYIDESLADILARDNASKHSFRRVSSFPVVSQDDIGMKVYLVGRGNYQLISADPEPQWKQLSDDKRNPAFIDWVQENYQPISKLLSSLAKLTNAQQAIPYFSGPEDIQATTMTEYARQILSKTDDKGIREALNLGDAATLNTPIPGTAIENGSITVDKVSDSFKQSLGWITGDCKITYRKNAESGWILLNDGSIGNNASGATTRANADTYDLFMLMWDNPYCEVQSFSGVTSTKTTAIKDWSANKRLVLPKVLGRAIACAGQGEGLTKRNLGQFLGDESISLDINSMPPHNHNLCSFRNPIGSKNAVYDRLYVGNTTYHDMGYNMQRWENDQSRYTQGGQNPTNAKGDPVDNMQPTSFFNVVMKL